MNGKDLANKQIAQSINDRFFRFFAAKQNGATFNEKECQKLADDLWSLRSHGNYVELYKIALRANAEGFNPMHLACMTGEHGVIELIIESFKFKWYQADLLSFVISPSENEEKQTPQHLALENDDDIAFEILLRGVRSEPEVMKKFMTPNNAGQTVFHIAARDGKDVVVGLMCQLAWGKEVIALMLNPTQYTPALFLALLNMSCHKPEQHSSKTLSFAVTIIYLVRFLKENIEYAKEVIGFKRNDLSLLQHTALAAANADCFWLIPLILDFIKTIYPDFVISKADAAFIIQLSPRKKFSEIPSISINSLNTSISNNQPEAVSLESKASQAAMPTHASRTQVVIPTEIFKYISGTKETALENQR